MFVKDLELPLQADWNFFLEKFSLLLVPKKKKRINTFNSFCGGLMRGPSMRKVYS